jgi:tape measure domain-containing protein
VSSRQLQVVLDLDTSNYSGRLTSAGSQMRVFGGQVKETASHVDTLGHSLDKSGQMAGSSLAHLRDYVLTIAGIESIVESFGHKIVGVMEEAISMSAELERQTLLMKGMSTAVTEAGKIQEAREDMAALFEMSKNTGYSIQDLSNSFVRLKSTGIDPMKGMLQETTDAVAAFGGNSYTMQHVSLALQEMADKGTLSLKELRRQFAIFVPDGMRTMANVLGMTMDEMVKKISLGSIAARPAMELMMRQLGVAHAGAAEQMSQTLVGQMNAFKTNMIQMAASFTGEAAGMSDSLYGTIKNLMGEINTALQSSEGKAAFHEIGQDIAEIVRGLASLVRFLVEYRAVIIAFGEAVATAFALKLIRAWGTDVVAMFANVGRASAAWWTAEKTTVPTVTQVRQDYNLSLIQGVRANQELLESTAQRASAEAEAAQIEEDAARIQRANAIQALQSSRSRSRRSGSSRKLACASCRRWRSSKPPRLSSSRPDAWSPGSSSRVRRPWPSSRRLPGRLATAEAMLARTDAELALPRAR